MELQTKVRIPSHQGLCSYQKPVLCMGSCFADMMGTKLSEAKFTTLSNPLGILYNPLALANCLEMMVDDAKSPDWTYAEHLDSWLSFELHSQMSHRNKDEVIEKTQGLLNQARQFMGSSPLIILTFGTAVAYRHQDSGKIVGNCHKYPASLFQKEILDPEAMVNTYTFLLHTIKKNFPNVDLMLTVSPIRHIKDTLKVNSLSKSILRMLCHQLEEKYSWVTYFPSFEIMVDELRDYRFYGADMLHPTAVAEDWIWEKFLEAYLNEGDMAQFRKWEKVRNQLAHRPRFPHTSSHHSFLIKLRDSLEQLSTSLDCEAELKLIRAQIANYPV